MLGKWQQCEVSPPHILVTGFGSFLAVQQNPSGLLATTLADDPPAGVQVTARELPVSFDGAPALLARAIEAMEPKPDGLLALGVHHGAGFRLERNARAVLDSKEPDVDGRHGSDLKALPEGDLTSGLDLEGLRDILVHAGADDARISDGAGGYVCERIFHAVLAHGRRLGIPGLFLHVPSAGRLPTPEQLPIVRDLLVAFASLRSQRDT